MHFAPRASRLQHGMHTLLVVFTFALLSNAAALAWPSRLHMPARGIPILSAFTRPSSMDHQARAVHRLRATAIPGEHVVLADCFDQAARKPSSQMAYFRWNNQTAPQDVAIVATPDGQSAVWASTTTKAHWADTGITFTAVLGPKVDDGNYAGTGQNDFNNYTCWQTYIKNLYTWNTLGCSQVYRCDQRPPPSSMATPQSNSESSGLPVGAVIGLVISIAGATLLAATGGIFFYMRRRAQQQDRSELTPELDSSGTPKSATQELYSANNYAFELTTHPRAHEMPVQSPVEELDSANAYTVAWAMEMAKLQVVQSQVETSDEKRDKKT